MADVGKRMYWVTSSGVEFVEIEWYSKCKIVYTCAHKEDIYNVYVCFHIYIYIYIERGRESEIRWIWQCKRKRKRCSC